MATYSITQALLNPMLLKGFLTTCRMALRSQPDLKIFSSSAALSKTLRQRARAKLAPEIFDIYGSNEAGYVSSISDDNEFGSIWPGVQVEVVDDR